MCDLRRIEANSKPARIRALERVLCDPLHIQDAIRGLSAQALRLLRLAAPRPSCSAPDLVSVAALYAEPGTESAVEEAVRAGLLLACPEGDVGAFAIGSLIRENARPGDGPHLFVPTAVCELLPEAPPLPHTVTPADHEVDQTNDTAEYDTATSTFLETLRILELITPRVTASGSLHKSDLSRAHELAREAGMSADAMNIAVLQARALGCVEIEEGRLVLTSRAERWAEQSRPDRMRDLFQAYLASDQLDDINVFFSRDMERMEAGMPPGTLRRRYHRLLPAELLRALEQDKWYSLAAVIDQIRRLDRNVLFLEEPWRDTLATSRNGSGVADRLWTTYERRFYEWIFRTIIGGLNMVEWAMDGTLFRMTPIGSYALGIDGRLADCDSDEKPEGRAAVVVQPNFEVVAYLDRGTPELRRRLDTFCERVRGGVVSTYRLTQDSVYRGVRSGMTIRDFQALLERNTLHPLPTTVVSQFEAWERKLGALRVHPAVDLVECASAREAEALAASADGARVIGERFVLGAPAPEDASVIDYAEPVRATYQQEEGLVLRSPWRDTDLLLQRRSRALGDVSVDPTGDVVLRVGGQEPPPDSDSSLLIAELEALAPEPLAARYRASLRAATGEGGRACTGSASLARFDDAETCDAVLELPEAADLVEGRLGLFTLVVRHGSLAAFKKVLRAQGIQVAAQEGPWDDGPPAAWMGQWSEQRLQDPEEEPVRMNGSAAATPTDGPVDRLPAYSPRITREILEDAIRRRRPVLIAYQSSWSSRPSIRRVNPVTVDVVGPAPTLSGYCHHLQSSRAFRLSRVKGIRVLEDESF